MSGGRTSVGNRKHSIWMQCGNCHNWNLIKVDVGGCCFVTIDCCGENCDCQLIVGMEREPLTLNVVSEITMVTRLA